jgi:hypothetical protein
MVIAHAIPSFVRSYDGLIVLGYIAVAVVMLAAIYFASGGPSFTEVDLSAMAMMP